MEKQKNEKIIPNNDHQNYDSSLQKSKTMIPKAPKSWIQPIKLHERLNIFTHSPHQLWVWRKQVVYALKIKFDFSCFNM